MLGLGGGPVFADPVGGRRPLEAKDGLDTGERGLELAQRRGQACLLELGRRIEAVAELASTRAGGSSPSSS
jgi:hypothetical protein